MTAPPKAGHQLLGHGLGKLDALLRWIIDDQNAIDTGVERRRREVAPTLTVLRESLLAPATEPVDQYAQERMREMYELVDLANTWFDDLQRLSPESMAQLMKMGAKVQKLLNAKDRLFGVSNNND